MVPVVGPLLAEASPHTRGWTVVPAVSAAGPDGFPAHAGMDPDRRLG